MTQVLGPIGIWSTKFEFQPAAKMQETAAELEELGYSAIWFGEAVGREALTQASLLLAGTRRITIATGIANIYARDAVAMAAAHKTLTEAYPGRFILGLGVSHIPLVEQLRGHRYDKPVPTMRAYLDAMDKAPYHSAPPSTKPVRVLAALGPKMLELAREKANGAHPYNVTPEHTAQARSILGKGPWLCPEHAVVLETSPSKAREIGRKHLSIYLALPNYKNNWLRLGFTEDDFANGGSDRLIDAMVAWGDLGKIRDKVRAHRDAGADHVSIQVLTEDPKALALREWVRGYKFRSEGAVRELVLSQDVSKQIEVQEALLRSQDKLRSLIDHAPFGVFRSSITGDRFETVNPAMLRLLGGYSLEEATQLRLSQQFYARAKDRDLLLEILLTNGSVSGFETAIVRRDGSSIPVRLSGTVSRSGEGAPDCFQGYLEDLTAQSSLEQQFRQAQKLEAVGRLAGGVAHDFNNILLVIKLSTELMLQQVTTDNPLTKSLLQIAQATERATSLTKQLLALGRRQIMQARVINLNTVVSDTSKMLQRIIGEDIHLVTRLSESLDNVKLDPDQFTQVLLNLAVNARDAMSDGGVLEIATSNVELDDAYAAMHHPVQPGRYVMVVVSDSGTGIEKSTLPRIFDPFFTTKDVGKGTGLGLSIVYGIVKQSGGYIWVYSEPGQGTTFKLYFPVVEAAVAATTTTHSNSMTAASGQIMLLVENEDLIRSNMRECLRQMGYRVLEAANAEEALEIARREKGAIDLLLTDLVLTGMRGDELAKGFANLHPHAGVLFMSGYTEETAARRDIFEAGSSFLQKPFSVADLAHAVSAALSVATSEI